MHWKRSKIVVDDLDLHEPVSTSLLDKVVLPPLALQFGLYLRLRRLAHVHHGLAPQDGIGN